MRHNKTPTGGKWNGIHAEKLLLILFCILYDEIMCRSGMRRDSFISQLELISISGICIHAIICERLNFHTSMCKEELFHPFQNANNRFHCFYVESYFYFREI